MDYLKIAAKAVSVWAHNQKTPIFSFEGIHRDIAKRAHIQRTGNPARDWEIGFSEVVEDVYKDYSAGRDIHRRYLDFLQGKRGNL